MRVLHFRPMETMRSLRRDGRLGQSEAILPNLPAHQRAQAPLTETSDWRLSTGLSTERHLNQPCACPNGPGLSIIGHPRAWEDYGKTMGRLWEDLRAEGHPPYHKTVKACFDSTDSALGRGGRSGDLAEPEGGGHDPMAAGGEAVVERRRDLSDEPVGNSTGPMPRTPCF